MAVLRTRGRWGNAKRAENCSCQSKITPLKAKIIDVVNKSTFLNHVVGSIDNNRNFYMRAQEGSELLENYSTVSGNSGHAMTITGYTHYHCNNEYFFHFNDTAPTFHNDGSGNYFVAPADVVFDSLKTSWIPSESILVSSYAFVE